MHSQQPETKTLEQLLKTLSDQNAVPADREAAYARLKDMYDHPEKYEQSHPLLAGFYLGTGVLDKALKSYKLESASAFLIDIGAEIPNQRKSPMQQSAMEDEQKKDVVTRELKDTYSATLTTCAQLIKEDKEQKLQIEEIKSSLLKKRNNPNPNIEQKMNDISAVDAEINRLIAKAESFQRQLDTTLSETTAVHSGSATQDRKQIIEKSRKSIEKQREDIEPTLQLLKSKIAIRGQLIEDYNRLANQELHVANLLTKCQLADQKITAIYSENKIAVDQMLSQFQEERKKITLSGKEEKTNFIAIGERLLDLRHRLLENEESYKKIYAEVCEILANPNVSQEAADAAYDRIKECNKARVSLEKEIALVRVGEKTREVNVTDRKINNDRKRLRQQFVDLYSDISGFITEYSLDHARFPQFSHLSENIRSYLETEYNRFPIINEAGMAIGKLDESSPTFTEELNNIMRRMDIDLQAALEDKGNKMFATATVAADALLTLGGAAQKIKNDYVDKTLIDTRNALHQTLQGQANHWSSHQKQIHSGTKIMHLDSKGKRVCITVPTGIGEMMIALDPTCKPRVMESYRKKVDPPTVEIKPDMAWEQLQKCKKIADIRDKKTSFEKRRTKNSKKKDAAQDQNTSILETLSTSDLFKPKKDKDYSVTLMSVNEFRKIAKNPGTQPILVYHEDGRCSLYGNKNGVWKLTPLKKFRLTPGQKKQETMYVSPDVDAGIFNPLKIGHTETRPTSEEASKLKKFNAAVHVIKTIKDRVPLLHPELDSAGVAVEAEENKSTGTGLGRRGSVSQC